MSCVRLLEFCELGGWHFGPSDTICQEHKRRGETAKMPVDPVHRNNAENVCSYQLICGICSEHFTRDCFTIQYQVPGIERRLVRDEIGVVGVPTIYKAPTEEQLEPSARDRRKVSFVRYSIGFF